MECPGLHSVYADLALEFDSHLGVSADLLAYSVGQSDRRFQMVGLDVAGPGAVGKITTLFRSAPVLQPSFAEIRADVAPRSFADTSALVIGGSRGLGEVMAKILAAGGSDTVLTYHRGREDAMRVAEEINSGGGLCRIARYDVETGENDLFESAPTGWSPTHVHYFATPPIRVNRSAWNSTLFSQFCGYYVDGFAALIETVERATPMAAKRRYVYPSTVYVENPPNGLLEYAVAKRAGEALCDLLSKKAKTPIEIAVIRLPRLLTDQTGGDSAAAFVSTVEALRELAP
jgi:NAD(P)-dependent dehydrogenase (short-subunit alcohol dehydrogenase family)